MLFENIFVVIFPRTLQLPTTKYTFPGNNDNEKLNS